mgnify:CR=1 FL=1
MKDKIIEYNNTLKKTFKECNNVRVKNIFNHLHYKSLPVYDICDYIIFTYNSELYDEFNFISPYINKKNFLQITSIINDYDILGELFNYLPYDVVSLYSSFDLFEERWISNKKNFKWCILNNEEILEKYLIDSLSYKYYKICGVIYDNNLNDTKPIIYLFDLYSSIYKDCKLQTFKYLMNIVENYVNNNQIWLNSFFKKIENHKNKEGPKIMEITDETSQQLITIETSNFKIYYKYFLDYLYMKSTNEEIKNYLVEKYDTHEFSIMNLFYSKLINIFMNNMF